MGEETNKPQGARKSVECAHFWQTMVTDNTFPELSVAVRVYCSRCLTTRNITSTILEQQILMKQKYDSIIPRTMPPASSKVNALPVNKKVQ
jgi:hypothetical protein